MIGVDQGNWFVYILECRDKTLYTGITDDYVRRIAAHNAGKGAKYTRGRGPLRLRYLEACPNRSEASKKEFAIKQLTRKEKLALCEANSIYHNISK